MEQSPLQKKIYEILYPLNQGDVIVDVQTVQVEEAMEKLASWVVEMVKQKANSYITLQRGSSISMDVTEDMYLVPTRFLAGIIENK
jgi:hypothetical protein